jgi:hypothetical protein
LIAEVAVLVADWLAPDAVIVLPTRLDTFPRMPDSNPFRLKAI